MLDDETKLPDEEDILSDIALFIDKDGEYLNSWESQTMRILTLCV